jgi:GAF domain-containing protein
MQERLDEGPCIDAARSELFVRCNDFRSDSRWPRFGPEAVGAGVLSSLSFRLYTNEDTIGALNLFALTSDAFSDEDEELGRVLATHAAVALYAANKTEQFKYGIDAVQAFDLISRLSQTQNIPVAALAAELVDLGSESNKGRSSK